MKKQFVPILLFLIFIVTGLFAQSNIKWEQPFDDLEIPDGWQVIDADESGNGLILVDSAFTPGGIAIVPQSGQGFWTSNVQNANLAGVIDEWLISPRISVIYAGDSLHFWAGAVGEYFDDSLRVKISTTNDEPASFKYELGNFRIDGPAGSWHQYSFDLSDFDSSDIFLALNYYIQNGGPGGENSDFIWIDHPFISGDPSTLNNPPSITYLEEPADNSFIDINLPSVEFQWSPSTDLDGENLKYTLSIVNVFPVLQFSDIPDTVFSLSWHDWLNENFTYRWTIDVSDGKSRVASPDTFSFQLADPSLIASSTDDFPQVFALDQNYPNPFNPTTMINYQLPITSDVELSIYNLLGQKVANLVNEQKQAGNHSVQWDASGYANGIYYYRIEAGEFHDVKKMILIR
jgi:hypothetical protein